MPVNARWRILRYRLGRLAASFLFTDQRSLRLLCLLAGCVAVAALLTVLSGPDKEQVAEPHASDEPAGETGDLPAFGPKPGENARPVLTIVIDDIGENSGAVRTLVNLPYQVTLSVWPQSTHASYSAKLAHERGRQVFIHQPMEPLRPERRAIEPNTLRVGMSRAQIQEVIRASLAAVPYAEGLNNHMGSRFTADARSLEFFFEELRGLRPDFMILDSLTHEDSLLYLQARQYGFAAFERNVFLDDDQDTAEGVLAGLNKGLELAKQHGRAIVIGHPRPATLAALRKWPGDPAGEVLIAPLSR